MILKDVYMLANRLAAYSSKPLHDYLLSHAPLLLIRQLVLNGLLMVTHLLNLRVS